ncbi:MAG: aminoacyl-tRNA hydrolase [Planctomycetota bacterium]|nr:aminoacyl-tRNA hydrolase [Planctomycetota bacterium]MCX8039694.1 aminoacyl-tRNA hydrolase [Planctomycetota bacterium]MDW8372891.1 aminoacyl-tRNA hydrolase [Planctomycetota bacterium]
MPGERRLVVGLGNPGASYRDTRHNAGFAVLERLAERHGVARWEERCHSLVARWASPQGPVLLARPQTFVNGSGLAVQALLAEERLPLAALLVVVDDLHLPLGRLRLRAGGGDGGHNGLRDIAARLGTGYARLRLGIGAAPAPGEAQVAHVLGRWRDDERPALEAMLERAADAVELWLRAGAAAAQAINAPPAAGR